MEEQKNLDSWDNAEDPADRVDLMGSDIIKARSDNGPDPDRKHIIQPQENNRVYYVGRQPVRFWAVEWEFEWDHRPSASGEWKDWWDTMLYHGRHEAKTRRKTNKAAAMIYPVALNTVCVCVGVYWVDLNTTHTKVIAKTQSHASIAYGWNGSEVYQRSSANWVWTNFTIGGQRTGLRLRHGDDEDTGIEWKWVGAN